MKTIICKIIVGTSEELGHLGPGQVAGRAMAPFREDNGVECLTRNPQGSCQLPGGSRCVTGQAAGKGIIA